MSIPCFHAAQHLGDRSTQGLHPPPPHPLTANNSSGGEEEGGGGGAENKTAHGSRDLTELHAALRHAEDLAPRITARKTKQTHKYTCKCKHTRTHTHTHTHTHKYTHTHTRTHMHTHINSRTHTHTHQSGNCHKFSDSGPKGFFTELTFLFFVFVLNYESILPFFRHSVCWCRVMCST